MSENKSPDDFSAECRELAQHLRPLCEQMFGIVGNVDLDELTAALREQFPWLTVDAVERLIELGKKKAQATDWDFLMLALALEPQKPPDSPE